MKTLSFIWPQMLWLLLLVPAAAAVLWRIGGRRRTAQAGWPGLRAVGGSESALLRHLPRWLLLAALTLWLIAAARPVSVVTLPSAHETVILAIDSSGSMRATDMSPNRLGAAQLAAKAFIESHPRSTRIGIVSFAGTAALVQPPTDRREELEQAIERLQPQRGTALGSAIVVSLAAIFPGAGIDLNSVGRPAASAAGASREDRRDGARPAQPPGAPGNSDRSSSAETVAPGSFESALIVLLTDGQSTAGPDPIAAARLAAQRGVRIYTVGLGTSRGEVLRADGWSMRVGLDESTLKTVSDLTRGEYFQAQSAADLKRLYGSLSSRFMTEKQEIEIGALIAALATLLSVIAATLSMLRSGRIH